MEAPIPSQPLARSPLRSGVASPLKTAAPGREPGWVRFQRPELPSLADVQRYYARSEELAFFSNGGPCAVELQSRMTGYLGGGTRCVPVANATLGLMAAMRAAFGTAAGRRRLVLTPSFTFTATACAIEWCGFEPVFVDIDPDAWHLDPDRLAAALDRYRGRVAGVLSCSTFGSAPPVATRAAWRAVCGGHDVPLVIDSAPGFGALDEAGRRLGGVGDTEIFSFHATKPFSIGEGGLVATADPEVAERLQRGINFGLEPGTRVSGFAGLNAKLSEVQCATALAMLDRFESVLARRRNHALRLREAIGDTPVRFQEGAERSPWQFLQLELPSAAARDRAVRAAAVLHIETRTLHDPPLHRHEAFAACERADALAVTSDLARRSLSLPLANQMSGEEIDRVAAAVACAV